MMKQLIVSITLIVLTLSLQAQQVQLYAGNVPGKNAVELKWLGKSLNRDDSYDIYRKQSGGSWQKLNTAPIKRAVPLTEKQMEEEAKKPSHDDLLIIYSNAFIKSDEGDNDPEMKYFILYILAPTQNKLAQLMGIYYEDATASAGTAYEYCVTKAGGNPSSPLASTAITAAAYTQSSAPAGFEVKAKDKKVDFKWSPDKKFSQYRIYRTSVAKGNAEDTLSIMLSEEQIKNVGKGETIATDNDSLLQNDKTYYYKVCGVDFFGNESKMSAELAATPVDMTPPTTVFALKTVLVDKGIKIKWKPSTEKDVVGYNVFKSNNAKSGFAKLNNTMLVKADSVYIDKNVKETEQCFYYLEIIDKKGNVGKTDVISYIIPDMTPPAIPKNLTAKADTGQIILKWDKNTENDVAGYYVFRALKNEDSNFQLLNAQPVNGTSYLDTLPKRAGNRFLYRICAVDKNYNRSGFTQFISVRMPDIVNPEPVVLKSAEWEGNKVKLEWIANFDPDLKGYEVYRGEADTANIGRNVQKINATLISGKTATYTDDKAIPAKKWQYYVVCIDSSGNRSEASNKLNITGELMEVAKGSITLKATYNASAKAVSLSWNTIGGVQRYQVLRQGENGTYRAVSGVGNETSFSDKTVSDGQSYSYKIVAIPAMGDDIYSNEAKVKAK